MMKRRRWPSALAAALMMNLLVFALLPVLTRERIDVVELNGIESAVRVMLSRNPPRADRPRPTMPDVRSEPPEPLMPQPPEPEPLSTPMEPEPIPDPQVEPPELTFEINPEIDPGPEVPPPPPQKTVKKEPEPQKVKTQAPKPRKPDKPKAQTARTAKPHPAPAAAASGPSTSDKKSNTGKTTTAKASSAGDQSPRLIKRIEPDYPHMAKRRKIQGVIVANLLVDDRGRVREVKIVRADPKGIFENSVKKALFKWQFEPGVSAGQTTTAWVRQTVLFRLEH
jgi:periplasmic protein TonB